MPTLFGLFPAILSLFYTFAGAGAFTVTFGTPSQCDNLPLTWTGGTPPFQLLIIPVFGTPTNISIPSSAFNNGMGNYSFQLPLASGSQMVFTMSDATGFNSGGSTDLLTVQPSKGGSCNTNGTQVAFSFQLNSALQQCRPFVFSGYTGAVQPVTINAVIPGGDALTLNPPVGPTSFSWNVNVAHGTSMIFFMTDANGRQGGSSDVDIVGTSDDSTCLNSNSPSSTSSAPSATAPSSPTSSASPSSPASSGISIAAVAGTVIGSLLFLAVIITLGLFFLRRKRDEGAGANHRRQSRRIGSGFDPSYDPAFGPPAPQYDLIPQANGLPTSPYPYSASSSARNTSNPFLGAPPSQYDRSSQYLSGPYPPSEADYQNPAGYRPPSQLYPPQQTYPPSNHSSSDPFHPAGPPMHPGTAFEPFTMAEPSSSRDSMSTAQRKAAMARGAAEYKPPRFVVHTDVEDGLPPPNEDGVVELPPQYSERRVPMDPLPPSAGAGHHQPGALYPS